MPTTITQLKAEIKTDFKSYEESGLIDDISLDLWIRNALQRFGGNIQTLQEKTIEVSNGQAKLPDNFYSLHLAVKCAPTKHEVICGEEDELQSVYQYRVRTEAQREWDNQSNQYKTESYKEVTEKIFFHNGKSEVDFHYRHTNFLRLTKGFVKEKCHKSCVNLSKHLTYDSPYEINIQGDYVQANFNKGFIYIQYYGLQTNEEGDILIPDMSSSRVYEYLMYHCKRRILENIWQNGDEDNLQNKIQYMLQMERDAFSVAMTEAKFSTVSGYGWWKSIKKNNQLRTRIYEQYARGK